MQGLSAGQEYRVSAEVEGAHHLAEAERHGGLLIRVLGLAEDHVQLKVLLAAAESPDQGATDIGSAQVAPSVSQVRGGLEGTAAWTRARPAWLVSTWRSPTAPSATGGRAGSGRSRPSGSTSSSMDPVSGGATGTV
jgi:hypothetical protein